MSIVSKNTHEEKIDVLESSIESIESKGGSLFITATGLTTDFAPANVIERDTWTFKGKEVRWRHEIPEANPKNLIGHIHEAFVENEKIRFVYEVWGYRDDLKEIQEQIKNNEVSISAGYRKITNNEGNVVGFYGRELSVTPFPKCTKDMGCGNEVIIANENNTNQREENMPEDKELISMLKEVIAKNEKSIKKLEETNEKLAKERGEQIVRLEGTISAMEKRISDSNEIIAEQTEKIESLESELAEKNEELASSKTLALRMDIVQLEGITDEEAKKAELEDLIELNENQLKKMKERLERAAKIAKKTAPSRQTPALGENITENEDLDKLTPEQLSMKLNPQLNDYIQQNERSRGVSPYSTNKKEDGVPML